MIEEGIYSRLTGLTGVSSVVGSKVFPNRIPQGAALPCVMYSKTSSVHDRHLRGATGVAAATFQIDCYASGATGYSTVKSLADAIRLGLDSYRGLAGDETVLDATLDSQTDFYDPPAHAQDHGTHRVSMDFTITYRESINPAYS